MWSGRKFQPWHFCLELIFPWRLLLFVRFLAHYKFCHFKINILVHTFDATNVCSVKKDTKHSSVLLLGLVSFFTEQTLLLSFLCKNAGFFWVPFLQITSRISCIDAKLRAKDLPFTVNVTSSSPVKKDIKLLMLYFFLVM